jgi:putative ABC transport system permease protein
MTGFALRMARRETRGSWRHVGVAFACIALGVAALTGVAGFAATLHRTLGREAKALLGGDVELRSARPLAPAEAAALARAAGPAGAVTRIHELVGMARAAEGGASLLVELKAVEPAYPLYGRLETEPARPLADLLRDDGALVQDTLLPRLGLRVGDHLWIGAGRFAIRGVIRREPDRSASMFTLGPRVLIAADALPKTALVQFGSRVRYRALARLPDGSEAADVRAALLREVPDVAIRVTAYEEAQPGLRRFFDQLTTYLGLVGLVSLLVGGIGVAASVRTFVERKRTTIAILKCLGADSRQLLATYLVQALALGGIGSLAGAALGVGVTALLVPLLGGFLPFEVAARVEPLAALRGIATGLLATLLCVLWPLRRVRTVPPALILRERVEAAPARGARPWLASLPVVAGLVLLAFWQAGSPKVGAIFVGAAGGALALLALTARGLTSVTRRLPRLPSLAWRQGVGALHRPGSQTTGIVVALGVGVMLVVAVALLERSLGRWFELERRGETPSFFFVDVQPDQAEPFARTVREAEPTARPELVPVVRGRLVAIGDRPVGREHTENREDAWRYTREYVLTYAASPPATNTLTRGRWWTAEEAQARPRISVEEEAARSFGVGIGGTLAFDIQGVRIEAEVMSLRRVDWRTLSANFFVIFSQGALDGAPLAYVATARVPPATEPAVQDAVVRAFPNVTAIPVRDIMERASVVMDQIAIAVRVIALFVIGAGVVVLASALAASRYQRLYESALLRTLGASRTVVARAFAVEYACLGATAGVGGSLLALVLAWIVLRFILQVPWTFEPAPLALGLVGSVVLALAVGFLATFRLLGQRPLPLLRRE